MKTYNVTPSQILMLDKSEEFRNNTIDMAIKINAHLDNETLLKAMNKEIERNEGLRLHCFKKFFKWYNIINDVYTINEVRFIDLKGKNQQEVEEYIDELCSKQIILKKAEYPFEIYQIVTNDYDYLVLRVLHVNMDAYAVLLTLADILKVYYSIVENKELTDQLTSVESYIENIEKNKEKLSEKTKQDNKFFIDLNDSIGEPTYLSCGGGYDGKTHRVKYSIYKNHPCSYRYETIDKETSSICLDYCSKNNTNIVSLFLSILEIYYSAVNNGFNDISMFFSANLRAKLTEKKLPFSTASAIFFRRIINNELTVKEFIKECDNEYMADLKHWCMDISAIMKYLLTADILHINGRYDQLVFTLLPTSFEGLPEGTQIEPYWPKAKEANDYIVYFICLLNNDGTINTFYRYLNDIIFEEDIIRLSNGVKTIIKNGISNPDIKVCDLMKLVK